MATKNRRHVRIRVEDKLKLNKIKEELASIQKENISDSEVLRRAFNIPNLGRVLKEDAMLKRRVKSLD